MMAALCGSCLEPQWPTMYITANPLGRQLSAVPASAGPFRITANILNGYDNGFGTGAIPVPTPVTYISRMDIILTLFEHGTTVEISEWHDATNLRDTAWVIGDFTNDFSVLRNIRIDTNVGTHGPYYLGEAEAGAMGSGTLEYGLLYMYPTKPRRIWMELTFQLGPSGIVLGGFQRYPLVVENVY